MAVQSRNSMNKNSKTTMMKKGEYEEKVVVQIMLN
jgi:hypothetical protein